MLKFAIIGPSTENTKDLVVEIKRIGHSATVFKFTEISFEMKTGEFKAFFNDLNILDFDAFIFRGYNEHIYEAQLLAQFLVDNNKTIIEQTLASFYVRGKMQQAKKLAQQKIKHPATFQANNIEGWNTILAKMEFPIIAKPIFGRKGRGIEKLNTPELAREFFNANKRDYLAQQYFPIISDFRILVVGGKVVGGFQRFIQEGEYKSNIHGTKAEKIEISKQMEQVAVEAAKAMGYEVAGVDLFEHKGELYIIEVNVAPQWEKFKLVTGINPAQRIIEYALEKLASKK